MRRQRSEEKPGRVQAAKPVPAGSLPGKDSALLRGFDESLLTLQKAVGNRAVLRMLRENARDNDRSEQMDPGVRAFMERRFRADLGDVRIHRGGAAAEAARQLNSSAFTVGKDIYFEAQHYSPHTPEGTQLLAHELAHVLQQRGESGPSVGAQHEAEASAASKGIAGGSPRVSVQKTASPGIAKQTKPSPPAATAKLYQYTFEGQTFTLTEEQYQKEIARTIHNLGVEFNRVESIAASDRDIHKDFLEHTHNIFGVISDIIADTAPPRLGIWSWPSPAIKAGREALKNGRVETAGRLLKVAEGALRDAEREWHSYLQKTISGAETAESDLETTRDISFAIAIGTAAVVAAPVVAAGATTLGATGTTGTLVTGAVVTTGGGVTGAGLRAGSAAVGQELAFGHVQGGEIWKQAKEGFKHGAIDASTALVTAGAGKVLGEGTSVGGKVLRHAVAGGVGGGFSSGAEAISEGKSAREVLKATGVGVASGFAGGGVTKLTGGSSVEQSAVRRIVSGGAGSVVSGTTGAILSGGSREDVKRVVATSLISGIVSSSAAPEPASHTPEEPPPKRKQPSRAPEPEATHAQATKTPPELPAEPEKLPSNVVPREKLERMRLKKLAARRAGEERTTERQTKGESNVRSLEEMRQRKAAAGARKPLPPTEPESQVRPVSQEQVAEAKLKLAAGAERHGAHQSIGHPEGESRLRLVASSRGGATNAPTTQSERAATLPPSKEPTSLGPRRPSSFTREEVEAEFSKAQEVVPEGSRVQGTREIAEEQAIREQETPITPESQFADREHSRALRNALEASGIPVPPGHDAHHIVPVKGGGEAGDRARAVLEREGIHIDGAANGVPLPQTTLNPETIPEGFSRHQAIHTKSYFQALAAALEAAPPGTVRDLLLTIRTQIQEGRFPH